MREDNDAQKTISLNTDHRAYHLNFQHAVNLVFHQQFSDYLTKTNETTLEQLPTRLSSLYQSKGTWDPTSLDEISHTLPIGTVVTLTDPSGKLIATLSNMMEDMMHAQGGMSMRMSMTPPILSIDPMILLLPLNFRP